MARSTAIQRHAITAPVFGRGKLHRHRLVEILKANLDKRLILVVAPAGYGKTMLLADLTAHVDRPVCWVRLTEHDRDAARLAGVVFDSLVGRFRRLRRHLDLRGMETVPPSNLGRLMGAAIAEAGTPPFVLAFDDIHLVAVSKDATALLAGLVDGLQRHACCILAGREPLDLPLAKVAAADEVLAVGAGDLALADDELEELLRQDGSGEASAEVRDRLMSESRGWIAGIQLLRMRGLEALEGSLPSAKDLTFEYFGSEVLGKQTEAMRRFAIESSVLPVMTAEAVEAVVRVKDGARWLREAVRKGLFISATGSSPKTYEYHPLFREYLQGTLPRLGSAKADTLRSRCGSFLLLHGQEDLAFDYFIAAGMPKKALRVAEKAARGMRIRGHLETLLKWERLLHEAGLASPEVLLRIAHAFQDNGRIEDAAHYLSRSSKAARHLGVKTFNNTYILQRARLQYMRGHSKDSIRSVRRFVTRGAPDSSEVGDLVDALSLWANAILEGSEDVRKAVSLAERSVQLARRKDAYWSAAALLTYWATLGSAGKRDAALKAGVKCRMHLARTGSPKQTIVILNNSAFDAALDGNFDEALEYLRMGLSLAEKTGSSIGRATIFATYGDIYSDAGRPRDALAYYGEASRILQVEGVVPLDRYISFRRVVALRRMGEENLARKELQRLTRSDRDAYDREIEVEWIALHPRLKPRDRIRRLRQLRASKFSALRQVFADVHIIRELMELGEGDQAAALIGGLLPLAKKTWMLLPLSGEIASSSGLGAIARSVCGESVILEEIDTLLAKGSNLPEARITGQHKRTIPRLEVRALGSVGLEVLGRPSTLKPKARELLLLLVDRRTSTKRELMDLFWGNLEPAKRSANLHSSIYAIRDELGKASILVSGGSVSIGPTMVVGYDVDEFGRAASEGLAAPGEDDRLQKLQVAADQYTGPFAVGLESAWVRKRRAQLGEMFSTLALSIGEAALAWGKPGKALATLRRALEAQPERDDLRRRLIECLRAAGREAEALAAGLHDRPPGMRTAIPPAMAQSSAMEAPP